MISCVRFSTLGWGRWPYAPRLLLVVAITLSRREELWTSWVQNRLHQSVRNQICRKNFLICCQKIVAVSCLRGSVKGMLHCTTFQLSVSHSFISTIPSRAPLTSNLGLISKATVSLPLCILLGVMRSLKMKTKVFRLNWKLLSLKHKLK